jgi:hypothetical protein
VKIAWGWIFGAGISLRNQDHLAFVVADSGIDGGTGGIPAH